MGTSFLLDSAKPRVHLWAFNNPLRGITEQIDFLCAALRAHRYPFGISNSPSATALNIVIENFEAESATRVLDFCRRSGKRIAVILTEHLDFIKGRILFHGVAIDDFDDYMHPAIKRNRLVHLLLLRECLYGFLRLGDLPALANMELMLPGIPVRTMPFPMFLAAERPLKKIGATPTHDFVFTGKITDYRRSVLDSLGEKYSILRGDQILTRHGDAYQSRRCRDALNLLGRLVLNVPQRRNWPWISTMRVIAGLRSRRATATIGTDSNAMIAPACIQLDGAGSAEEALRQALAHHDIAFEKAFAAYEGLVKSPANPRFPEDFFDIWAALEL
jgi:hypothetical protein